MGGIRSGREFSCVIEGISIGISVRPLAGISVDWLGCAQVIDAVIKRIQSVTHFPTIRQAVAVGVWIQGIGFAPSFSIVIDPVAVGVARDESVEILVFPVTVIELVAVAIRVGVAGFRPGFEGVDDIVRPIAGIRAGGGVGGTTACERQGFPVAVCPTVPVGILDSVQQAIGVGVRIVRICYGSGGLAGAVISLALAADTRDEAMVFDHGIKRWIEVTDKIGESIAIGIGIKIRGWFGGSAPAHFQPVGQSVAI